MLLTYDGLGIGNLLYFALHAHRLRAEGRDYRVEANDALSPWLTVLPGLRPYFVDSRRIRPWDRREHIASGFFQAFGTDFGRADLEGFVSGVLLASPLFADAPTRAARLLEEDVLTVNVRRGDYYAVEEFRRIYGFDVAAYVRRAIAAAVEEHGRFGRIHVVSDGTDWCRAHLPWLAESADRVTFVDPSASTQDHLVDLALSPALVLANSTFSYWGAYIGNVLHGDNHGSVWAPRFFGRGLRPEGSDAWQLDPRWRAVDVPDSDAAVP